MEEIDIDKAVPTEQPELKKRPLGLSLVVGDITYHQGDLIKIMINNEDEAVVEVMAFDTSPDDICPILVSFRYLTPEQTPNLVDNDGAEPRFNDKALQDYDYDPKVTDLSRYYGDDYGWSGRDNVISPLTPLECQLLLLEHEIAAQP